MRHGRWPPQIPPVRTLGVSRLGTPGAAPSKAACGAGESGGTGARGRVGGLTVARISGGVRSGAASRRGAGSRGAAIRSRRTSLGAGCGGRHSVRAAAADA